ncbi:MAG: hypothetical protein PHE15_03055 [Dehalococcoidales bacterium]|nr:hypothetical protein [Dehalococcoidales bacterium]
MKDAEKKEIQDWLEEIIPLYRQAEEVTRNISNIDSDGLPVDLENLSEIWIKLPPILAYVKKMEKPKYDKLRQLQKDFKLMLDACIKAAKYRLKIENKPNRLWFSTAVFWANLAISFKKTLSPKIEKLSRNFETGGAP